VLRTQTHAEHKTRYFLPAEWARRNFRPRVERCIVWQPMKNCFAPVPTGYRTETQEERSRGRKNRYFYSYFLLVIRHKLRAELLAPHLPTNINNLCYFILKCFQTFFVFFKFISMFSLHSSLQYQLRHHGNLIIGLRWPVKPNSAIFITQCRKEINTNCLFFNFS
jgi:hypothetical protein